MSTNPVKAYVSAGQYLVDYGVVPGQLQAYLSAGQYLVTFYPTAPDAVPQSSPITIYVISSIIVSTRGPLAEVEPSASTVSTSVSITSP